MDQLLVIVRLQLGDIQASDDLVLAKLQDKLLQLGLLSFFLGKIELCHVAQKVPGNFQSEALGLTRFLSLYFFAISFALIRVFF